MIGWLFRRRPRLTDDERRSIRSYLAADCTPAVWEHRQAFVANAYSGYADIAVYLSALRFELGVCDASAGEPE